MSLRTAPWRQIEADLPAAGRSLRAQFDDDTVVVYQAYDEVVGRHAAATGQFGGHAWRLDRSSAIRTSLPAVLERSDWGRKAGREVVLAISLSRGGFDALLRQAIHAEFPEGLYPSKRSWQLATRYSQVGIDWKPDRRPDGTELGCETCRFRLRDGALGRFTQDWIVAVHDLSAWVREHRQHAADPDLLMPTTAPYSTDEGLLERLTWTPE